jgi:hypothetical protein
LRLIANWRQGNSVSLKVTGDEFVTQGNMGKLFETEQRIATKDVLGMSYRAGGEDELSGAYVKLRWGQRCVLPRVSDEQGRVTIDAITAKFPEIATDDSAFSIFGQGDQLITPSLSGSDKKISKDRGWRRSSKLQDWFAGCNWFDPSSFTSSCGLWLSTT